MNGNGEILILLEIAKVWNVPLKQNDEYQTVKTFWRNTLSDKKKNSAIVVLISKISKKLF